MKELFVLDGTGYIFRSYHAIGQMTNDKGESTNALYGFVRSVLKLQSDFQPDHLVVVFDGPNNAAERRALYPEYKAHRVECPPDLGYQIGWAQDFCKMLGLPTLTLEGVEADDTMGTLAIYGKKKGAKVYLCTSDKDLLQFVNDHVVVLQTYNNNLIIDSTAVQEKYGITPDQVVDYLAMVGDASDNVPGVPGIGPKTAAQLLQEMGTLEGVLAGTDKLKGKRKQTLEENRDLAEISKKLVQVRTDLEIPLDVASYQLGEPDKSALRDFYLDKGFLSLLKDLGDAPKKEEKVDYHLVEGKTAVETLLATLSKKKEISFDTETTAIDPMRAELVGIGLGTRPGESWYLPYSDELQAPLKAFFGNSKIQFYAHNAKYDLQVLHHHGMPVANIGFDTMLASYLLNSHSHRHSLDALALAHFSKVKIPIEELIGKRKKQITMREVDKQQVAIYCGEDVDYTVRLKQLFEKQLKTRKLEKLFFDLELPLMRILAKMERRGIYLDASQLHTMGEWLRGKLKTLEGKIHEAAGGAFNVKSTKQLGELLFEKMGITPPKKTKTGYSTNADVLELLAEEHPIAGLVLEFRSLEKLRSTYVETLPDAIHPETGRIHCTFNQFVAATGRLSAQNPNLQNIPVRSQEGRRIRTAFCPERPKWSYVAADYSQIELRLVAHFSEDPELLRAFQEGEDIHAFTASQTFNVPLNEVTKKQRHRAKAVNFGILYGQGSFGLARETGMTQDEAKAFIATYFERYPRVREFIESCKERSKKTGKAISITGRERLIPDIGSANPHIRAGAERLAVNTPLQGSAADLIKMAMLKVDKEIDRQQLNGFLILQVHDELIFEIPDGEIMAFEMLARNAMEQIYPLKVPLVVDVAVGKNWGEC